MTVLKLPVCDIQENPERTVAILDSFEGATYMMYKPKEEVYIIESCERDSTD